jgi:hypothetical protein
MTDLNCICNSIITALREDPNQIRKIACDAIDATDDIVLRRLIALGCDFITLSSRGVPEGLLPDQAAVKKLIFAKLQMLADEYGD